MGRGRFSPRSIFCRERGCRDTRAREMHQSGCVKCELMRILARSLLVGVLAFAGSAVTRAYAYQAETTIPTAEGVTPAQYPIPPGNPAGDVRLTTFGITKATPQDGGSAVSVLHVRMIIDNKSDSQPWTLDTRSVLASISGEGQSRPAFVNTDAGTPPTLQIAKGQQRVVDFYYPLPTTLASTDTVPKFEVTWQLRTSSSVIAERTPFQGGAATSYSSSSSYSSNYGDQAPNNDYAYNEYAYQYPSYGSPAYGYPYSPPYASPAGSAPPVSFSLGFGLGFGPFWWSDPF